MLQQQAGMLLWLWLLIAPPLALLLFSGGGSRAETFTRRPDERS